MAPRPQEHSELKQSYWSLKLVNSQNFFISEALLEAAISFGSPVKVAIYGRPIISVRQ